MEKILRAAFAAVPFFVVPLWGEDGATISEETITADLTQEKMYQNQEFNRLNWVEVSQGCSVQLFFDFTQPIYCKKKVIPKSHQLKLTFPGMRLQYFDKKQVLLKLSKLKTIGLAKKIELFEKTTKYPKVVLSIDFEKARQIKQEDGSIATVKNGLLIKWCKMEEPNRLVLDIFTQESLKKIKNGTTGVLYAHNTSLQTDAYGPAGNLFLNKPLPENVRIIIDAGHGGTDKGAQSFGLSEKALALDIALRTRSLLKKSGMSVFLTRNSDQNISLGERIELAHQLKANLFVAIHLNAGGYGPAASGLEIFHLNDQAPLPRDQTCGYLFVNLEKNMNYAAAIDKQLQEKTNFSHTLATTIQQEVIRAMRTKNRSIVNRGIKQGHFCVLFNRASPTALVEVGFITNPQEAKLLATAEYRQLIAQGICVGIKKYLKTTYELR